VNLPNKSLSYMIVKNCVTLNIEAYHRGLLCFDLLQEAVKLGSNPVQSYFKVHCCTHTHSFPARSVFVSGCLVTASNNGNSSASRTVNVGQ
jgi:hypothetical protein